MDRQAKYPCCLAIAYRVIQTMLVMEGEVGQPEILTFEW